MDEVLTTKANFFLILEEDFTKNFLVTNLMIFLKPLYVYYFIPSSSLGLITTYFKNLITLSMECQHIQQQQFRNIFLNVNCRNQYHHLQPQWSPSTTTEILQTKKKSSQIYDCLWAFTIIYDHFDHIWWCKTDTLQHSICYWMSLRNNRDLNGKPEKKTERDRGKERNR